MKRVLLGALTVIAVAFPLATPSFAAENCHENANLEFCSGGAGKQGGGGGFREATFPSGRQVTGGSGITRSGGNCAYLNSGDFCHGKGYPQNP
jgi:hypothetical protein